MKHRWTSQMYRQSLKLNQTIFVSVFELLVYSLDLDSIFELKIDIYLAYHKFQVYPYNFWKLLKKINNYFLIMHIYLLIYSVFTWSYVSSNWISFNIKIHIKLVWLTFKRTVIGAFVMTIFNKRVRKLIRTSI
jgi:hypothetical protein